MSAPASTGFLDSLHQLGDRLLATVQSRIELFSAELYEEKIRLIQSLIWIGAALLVGALALAFASLTLVFALWESARLAALGGLTLLYTGALAGIIILFRRHLARQPRPFADTLRELESDRTCIRAKN